MDPAILDLAFIFLLIGYGTKVGLAPLHAWLPDAHAEGPTPISAVLSGLLLNVALYALLRFKMIVAGQPAALDPGPVMIVMGLVSLIFAAFMLYQRRDIKRLFAYSSIEHMGLIVFAFGMGGPLANFAGLLHMAMHSLTKSASSSPSAISPRPRAPSASPRSRGLSVTHPRLAVAFALAVLAIGGMPPFGVFASEFLILTTTFAREPWLALLPAFGLLVGFGALLMRLQGTIFGEPVGPAHRVDASSVPMVLHLLLVLAAGIFLPPALVPGSSAPRSCSDERADRPGRRSSPVALPGRRLCRGSPSIAGVWTALAEGCAAGLHDLSALVGGRRQRCAWR